MAETTMTTRAVAATAVVGCERVSVVATVIAMVVVGDAVVGKQRIRDARQDNHCSAAEQVVSRVVAPRCKIRLASPQLKWASFQWSPRRRCVR